jgi:molybdopterin-guanine dinucleotide biosynthesis protein A
MGYPKAALPFGPETMLERVMRLLGEVADPLVVVAARDQELPKLPSSVLVARDDNPDRGPLEGLRVGLSRLAQWADSVEAAYATSCDVPLLVPEFVRRMIELLGTSEIAVPVEQGQHHPLAAVYRTSVVPHIERLLSEDRRRPAFLFDAVPTRRVEVAELRGVDPNLHTLANLNRSEDYYAALRVAGFEPPPEIVAVLDSGGPAS